MLWATRLCRLTQSWLRKAALLSKTSFWLNAYLFLDGLCLTLFVCGERTQRRNDNRRIVLHHIVKFLFMFFTIIESILVSWKILNKKKLMLMQLVCISSPADQNIVILSVILPSSSFLKGTFISFDFTAAGVKCRVMAVRSLPVHYYAVFFFFFFFFFVFFFPYDRLAFLKS